MKKNQPTVYFKSICVDLFVTLRKIKDRYHIVNSGSQKIGGKESSPHGAEGSRNTVYFVLF